MYEVNVQTMQGEHPSASYYSRKVEVSRAGFPYPNRGDEAKLKKIWNKFEKDEDEDAELSTEGTQQMFKQFKMDPNSLQAFVCFGLMELEEFGTITDDNFVKGFAKCGCSSVSDIKNRCNEISTQLSPDKPKKIKAFCAWLWSALRENDKSKYVAVESMATVFPIVCPTKKFPLQPLLMEFLMNPQQ
eukprot:UN28032